MTSIRVRSLAIKSQNNNFSSLEIERRRLCNNDILIDIHYCGVCHTDIHFVKNDLGKTIYPLVPGHEIIGRVKDVGLEVKKFKRNDLVGVGCMVDSCNECSSCKNNEEQFCENGMTMTYNSPDKFLGGMTFGGYSKQIVVKENFVLRVSENLDAKSVAPLLCAGIATFSPLKKYKIKKGDKVGIIGLGGLGHMGVKFSSALEAHTTMITSSEKKAKDAKKLGANEVIISTKKNQMEKNFGSFDFLLNTIPCDHDASIFLQLLKPKKFMVVVGLANLNINTAPLLFGRSQVVGSLIGGIKETQNMLDYCEKKRIVSDVELIDIKNIQSAYKRIENGDVKYRIVIDMKSL